MLGVVTVLHVRAGELPEANDEVDIAAAVIHAPDAIDVLATKLLPGRRILAIALQDSTFLEMHVHVVTPATAGRQVPDLDIALGRRRSDPVRIHAKAHAAVCFDRPWSLVGSVASPKAERAMGSICDLFFGEMRHRDHRLLTLHVVGRVHAQVGVRVLVHPYLHELAHRRVAAVVLAGQYLRERNSLVRTLSVLVLEHVDHVQLVARLVTAEIHDYVVAFGYGLGGKYPVVILQLAVAIEIHATVKRHRVLEDVAVVGDHVKRHPVVASIGILLYDSNPHEARHVAVQNSHSVPARAHIEEGLVQPVHRHAVAHEAVRVKNIKPELAFFAVRGVLPPGLARHQDLQIIVAIAPAQVGAAWQPQVYAVVDGLVAAIQGAVVVHHRGVALVNILGSVIEHVIVEPVRAHGLAPVTGDLDIPLGRTRNRHLPPLLGDKHNLEGFTGSRRTRICRIGIYRVVPRQHHGPVVVIKLAWQKERLRVAVALGRVVAIVLVGRDEMVTKAPVVRELDRQRIVMSKQYRLAVPGHQQLGRQRAVKGPQRWGLLHRHGRMKTYVYSGTGPLQLAGFILDPAEVQTERSPLGLFRETVHLQRVTQTKIGARAGLGGLEKLLGEELVPALVSVLFSRWASIAVRRQIVARQGHERAGHGLDDRLPGIAHLHVAFPGRKRVEFLGQEGVQRQAVWRAPGVRRDG